MNAAVALPSARTGDLPMAQDALNRMRRAYERGTGCYLTVEMIRELGVTFLGQIWGESDPRSGSDGTE